MVAAMPRFRAASASPAAPPSGAPSLRTPASIAVPPMEEEKCDIGSATPKNTRPIHMPAATPLATPAMSEYSGFAPGAPDRHDPRRYTQDGTATLREKESQEGKR